MLTLARTTWKPSNPKRLLGQTFTGSKEFKTGLVASSEIRKMTSVRFKLILLRFLHESEIVGCCFLVVVKYFQNFPSASLLVPQIYLKFETR